MQLPGAMPANPTLPRPNPIRPLGSSYLPTTMLPGFYVSSDDDISARDVVNDGSISFFPAKDLSHITIKQWNGNTLESAVYDLRVPKNQTQSSQLPPPPPPMSQNQPQDNTVVVERRSDPSMEALLAGFKQMNEGLANAFGQMGGTLNAIQQNLEKLNSRFMDEGGMG